jgi:hypothetical protein
MPAACCCAEITVIVTTAIVVTNLTNFFHTDLLQNSDLRASFYDLIHVSHTQVHGHFSLKASIAPTVLGSLHISGCFCAHFKNTCSISPKDAFLVHAENLRTDARSRLSTSVLASPPFAIIISATPDKNPMHTTASGGAVGTPARTLHIL